MNPYFHLSFLLPLCCLLFVAGSNAQPTPVESPFPETKAYDVAGIAYSKERDVVKLSVTLTESSSGKISQESTQRVIICAKNPGERMYRSVPVSESKADTSVMTNTYSLETGSHTGQFFRLKDDWEVFNYHLEMSSDNSCNPKNSREPANYDIQYIRNLDLDKPQVTLAQTHKWIAVRDNDTYLTKQLEIGLNTTACTKAFIELKSGDTVFASDESVICPDSTPTVRSLKFRPQFQNSLSPNQRAGTYKIWINGKALEDLILANPLDEFKISKSELYNDGLKIERSGPLYIVNQRNGEKRLEITTSAGGTLTLNKPECVRAQQTINSNLFVFTMDFSQCVSEDLLSFELAGSGNGGQLLEDLERRFIIKIENKTDFIGPVSFSQNLNQTRFRYKLNRKVDHRIEIQASLPSGVLPLGVFSNVTASNIVGSGYEQNIPENFLNTLRSTDAVALELKAGRAVPIVFKFIDTSADGNLRTIGEFEVNAYGLDRAELESLSNSNKKIEPPEARRRARKMLGLENVETPSPEQTDALNNLMELLGFSDTQKRNKTLKILTVFGNVGLRLLGVPVTL